MKIDLAPDRSSASLVLAVALACSYAPSPQNGKQTCDVNGGGKRCPSGYYCLDGPERATCWREDSRPSAGGAGGNGPSGSGGTAGSRASAGAGGTAGKTSGVDPGFAGTTGVAGTTASAGSGSTAGGSGGSGIKGAGGAAGASGLNGAGGLANGGGSTGLQGSGGTGGRSNDGLTIVVAGTSLEAHGKGGEVIATRAVPPGVAIFGAVEVSADGKVVGARLSHDGLVADDIWVVDDSGHVLVEGPQSGWTIHVTGMSLASSSPIVVRYDRMEGVDWISGIWCSGFNAPSPDRSWTVHFSRSRIGQASSILVETFSPGLPIEPTANICELPAFVPDGTKAVFKVAYPPVTMVAAALPPTGGEFQDLGLALKTGPISIIFQGHAAVPTAVHSFSELQGTTNSNAVLVGPRALNPHEANPFATIPDAYTLSDLIVGFDASKTTGDLLPRFLLYPSGIAPPNKILSFPLPPGALNGKDATLYTGSCNNCMMADLRLTPVLALLYQSDVALDLSLQLGALDTTWLLGDGASVSFSLASAPAPGTLVRLDLAGKLKSTSSVSDQVAWSISITAPTQPLVIKQLSFESR